MDTTSRRILPKLRDRILLGKIEVSPFCLGIVSSPEMICAAFDAGVNFFFLTADMHWPYYEHNRVGLKMLFERGKGIRDEVVVGVASYVTQPEFTVYPFLEVIEAVPGLEKIDVAIIGGAYGGEFTARLGAYEQNRRENRVPCTYIGASFHDRPAVVSAVNEHLTDLALLRYNPEHPGAAEDVFPHLINHRKTLLFNFKSTDGYINRHEWKTVGLGEEYWQPEVVDYYRFALSQPKIDGLLCALQRPQELIDLNEALQKGPLTEEEQKYLIDLAALASGEATLNQR